jgi:hypothetical protein
MFVNGGIHCQRLATRVPDVPAEREMLRGPSAKVCQTFRLTMRIDAVIEGRSNNGGLDGLAQKRTTEMDDAD